MASLTELKTLTDIHEANWSNWFNGKTSPKLDSLEAIAQKLGMPIEELIKAFMYRRDKNIVTPPSQ